MLSPSPDTLSSRYFYNNLFDVIIGLLLFCIHFCAFVFFFFFFWKVLCTCALSLIAVYGCCVTITNVSLLQHA